jgi:hypothetical protein
MDWKQSCQIDCRLAKGKTETHRVDNLNDRLHQEHQDGTLLSAILLVIDAI